MTLLYYAAVALAAFLAGIIVMALFAGHAINQAEELAERSERVSMAARWLARWNYAQMAAVEALYLESNSDVSYKSLRRLVDARIQRTMAAHTMQIVPTSVVPLELRLAAQEYNEALFLRGPDRDDSVTTSYASLPPEQQRLLQLQDAVAILLRGDSVALAERVLKHNVDPEKVLPSIY